MPDGLHAQRVVGHDCSKPVENSGPNIPVRVELDGRLSGLLAEDVPIVRRTKLMPDFMSKSEAHQAMLENCDVAQAGGLRFV